MGASSILLAEQIRPTTFKAAWLFEPIVISPTTFTEKNSKGGTLAASARKEKRYLHLAKKHTNGMPQDRHFHQ
ncbi:MAG: hypothetical protein CM15mP49_17580 [Actinomycetota bacterium]|nr:MAG: hypothetical protein CM15mP49_17580 [Actinomycetota bacterium]